MKPATTITRTTGIFSSGKKCTMVLSFAALLSPFASGATVTVPFSTDFDAFTTGTDISALFAESNTSSGNSSFIDAGAGDIVLRQTLGPATNVFNTAVSVTTSVPTLVASGGFEFSTTFTLDSFTVGTAGIINTSLNALSSNSNLSSGYRLNYTLSDGGSLILGQDGSSSNIQNIVGAAKLLPVAGNTLYTLTLRGIYTSPTSISLFGSISDGTTTRITTATDNAIPVTADNAFGIRSAAGNSTSNSSAQFTTTNFSLTAIPEPSGTALFTIGALGLLVRRRR